MLDHLAGYPALVAARRLDGFGITHPVDCETTQDAADGGRQERQFHRDPLARPALPAQRLDPCHGLRRGGTVKARGRDERS